MLLNALLEICTTAAIAGLTSAASYPVIIIRAVCATDAKQSSKDGEIRGIKFLPDSVGTLLLRDFYKEFV